MRKRSIAVLTALALTFGLVPVTAQPLEQPEAVVIEEAVLSETASLPAKLSGELFPESCRYEVTLTADNSGGAEYEGVLVTVVFDRATNQILSVFKYPVTVPADGEYTKTVYADYLDDSEYIRAFFWDGLSTMDPLARSISSIVNVSPEAGVIPLSAENVWSTDRQDEHGVELMFDSSKDTYMAGEAKSGAPVSVYAVLDRPYSLTGLSIGFHSSGNQRSYSFDVEGSMDGKAYYSILDKQNSNKANDLPAEYSLGASARYVKINVYGYNGNDSGWIRVNSLSLYGAPDAENTISPLNDGFTYGGSISSAPSDSSWFAYALDEETYTDYTPAMGTGLFARINRMPEEAGLGDKNAALLLSDSVDRTNNGSGAGSIGLFRKLPVPDSGADYTLKYKLFIPSDSENIYWAGFSLLSGAVTGGADLSPAAAVQLRLSYGKNGGAVINLVNSVQYNEGGLTQLFDSEFALGRLWDVTVRVSPQGKRADVTVSDGLVSETRTIGYAYTDVERVNNQTWANTSVNYIMFNTGAGGKLNMYIDDFSLTYDSGSGENVSKVIYSQNFENASTLADAGVEQAVVLKNSDGTTGGGSIGSGLQATVADSGTFGSRVLKLSDTNTTDGLVVAVPLTVPDNNNKYIIKWKMRDFAAANYSGVSLASGFNKGMTDHDHPMAVQMRYSMQSDGIQLNNYSSIAFNDGAYVGFMATGGNRLSTGAALEFSVEVNPLTKTMEITVTDGSRTLNKTHSFETVTSDGSYSENWSDKKVDTLLFHTSASGKSDCIIDNIQVIDTGIEESASSSAVHGIVRLESQWGTGKFITQSGESDLVNNSGIDPDLTRFVERPGLADPTGVSLESAENPGYFLYAKETHDVNHTFTLILKKLDGTAQDKAFATFYKQAAANSGSYSGTCVNYVPIWDISRKICYTNTSTDPISVMVLKDSDYTHSDLFYLRSEAVNFVSDNFKGSSLNSQWHNNYPWKKADQTNDSYNFSALIDYHNIEVSDGRLLLKATKASGWPTNLDGETGINYNGKYSKNWIAWAGRVGVISSKKVFYRQSLVSGRFKQPESPIGYWNAF
ncbi:MAG: AbfB domain-containing protein, partial [Clostridia bacterium]